MNLLIKGGRILDPSRDFDGIEDLYIKDGVIQSPDTCGIQQPDKVIQADGCFVMPGFIDLHVHLREPGFTEKETIETGCKAAARGGYTTIFAMPNTKPVADRPEILKQVEEEAGRVSGVRVHQIGAITLGQEGKELSDMEKMAQAGCLAFSEDGKSVMDSCLYRQAMEAAVKLELPVFAHCEDKKLAGDGVMNQDDNALRLGLPGISNAVEDVIAARDIILAKETGVQLHLCHCSTKDSVKMVEAAKNAGLRVTGEVCPHHFSMSSDEIKEDLGMYKMNPPLRRQEDVEALKQGLKDGIMDVIATDHAPHTREEKQGSMRTAPFGIVGLETAASLTYTHLVETGYLTPLQMAEKMSLNPAKVAGIEGGSIRCGQKANLVIFNPRDTYRIDPETFASKGKSTPFVGKEVDGRVICTIGNGQILYEA